MTEEPGGEIQLASEFPAATHDAWLKLVDKALKGAEFEKRLVGRSADGLRIAPLYAPHNDAGRVHGAGAGKPWRISARADHPVPAEAAKLALDDLAGGCDSLALVFQSSAAARGFGLKSDGPDDLDTALAGVMLDLITIRLDHSGVDSQAAAQMADLIRRRGLKADAASIDFGINPLGPLLRTGSLDLAWDTTAGMLAASVAGLRDQGFAGPFVSCDLRPIHEAGASEAQELAFALSCGTLYVRALVDHGLSLADAERALSWLVPVDADQFLGIAKLRALRRLWGRLAEASGITAQPIRIHAETSWRMMTKRDPWVNMLRSVGATFTAGVSGADSVTVIPFTATLGLPDGPARRIARNTQIILLEEVNTWRVADPAAGAGAFEALTDELARAAWGLFQEIESEGGLLASLTGGHLQRRVAVVRERRAKDIATGKLALTGTSAFPRIDELPPSVLPVAPLAAQPPAAAAQVSADPLPDARLAAPFETLRDRADQHAEHSGRRGRVFLASLGSIAEHTGRSTWVKNLLAAGGIDAVVTDGYASPDEAARAITPGDTPVVCICSSDAMYADHAVQTAQALRAAGAQMVCLAGRPGEREGDLTAAGVDQFLFAGQDMIATLQALQRACGLR